MGRFLAWTAAAIVATVAVGWIAIALLKALIGVAVYVIVGAAVIGGGVYLYHKGKRALSRDTRTRRRIEAATTTYRQRTR
jgi:predicted metal-binding membrane protein